MPSPWDNALLFWQIVYLDVVLLPMALIAIIVLLLILVVRGGASADPGPGNRPQGYRRPAPRPRPAEPPLMVPGHDGVWTLPDE